MSCGEIEKKAEMIDMHSASERGRSEVEEDSKESEYVTLQDMISIEGMFLENKRKGAKF